MPTRPPAEASANNSCAMQSKVPIYGHPIYQIIIVLPLGLLRPSSLRILSTTVLTPLGAVCPFGFGGGGSRLYGLEGFARRHKSAPGRGYSRLTNVVAMVVFLASLLLRLGDPSRPSPFATSVALSVCLLQFWEDGSEGNWSLAWV